MSKGTATLIQSAICRTNVRLRPFPTLFYYPGLTSIPVWNIHDNIPSQSGLIKISEKLSTNYDVILSEYINMREKTKNNSDYDVKDGHLHEGRWDWNSFVLKGKKQSSFSSLCPQTADILESFTDPKLMIDTPFSYAFFSTLCSGSSIKSHYGPCNLRIRCHFPLIVPSTGDLGMIIGSSSAHRWEIGKAIFFDDTFQHQVWNNSLSDRVVLLFDLW